MKVLAALALWMLTFTAGACETIGSKNHNPGNLMRGHCAWNSAAGYDERGYLLFKNDYQGLDALRKTLRTYRRVYRINTIERLCGRWVGTTASDKDKVNWVRCVRQRLNARPGQKFNFSDPSTAERLARGIVWAENSCDSYSDDLYASVFSKR